MKNSEASKIIESIVYVINMIIQEYIHVNGGENDVSKITKVTLLDHQYVSAFLATI
jgi:hypothetical protein